MLTKRLLELAAMTTIGDSLLCMLSPRRHTSLWLDGPKWWRRSLSPLVRHPHVTRAFGAAGLAFGLWLAWKQEPEVSELDVDLKTLPRRVARRFSEAMS